MNSSLRLIPLLALGGLTACNQQDPLLLQQVAQKTALIEQRRLELAELQQRPMPDLQAIESRIQLQKQAAAKVQEQVQALQPELDKLNLRKAKLERMKDGYDRIIFQSGLEVVGRVKSYENGKMDIEDGSGTVKSGQPGSIKSLTFRQQQLTPSDFPAPRQRPTPRAPRLPLIAANAPARLEVKMVRRSLSERRTQYSGDKNQDVSFTIRVTNREPLKDWTGVGMKIWAVSRDLNRKSDYQLILHESTTMNIARGETVEYDTKEVRLDYYDARYSSAKQGFKYYGFVLKLYDAGGEEIHSESTPSLLEREFNKFEKLNEEERFSL